MKKYNIKHKNVLFVSGLLVILLAAGFICYDFITQTRQNTNLISEEIAEREIEKKCKTISQAIEEQFDNLKGLALVAANYEDFGNEELLDTLAGFGLTHNDSRVSVVDMLGNSYSKGEKQISIADRDYFKRAVKGENVVSDLVKSRITGEDCIVFAIPVYKNSKIVGMIRNVYQNMQLDRLLHVSGTDAQENAYIVQLDGTIILSAGKDLGGQNFSNIFNTSIEDSKKKEIQSSMEKLENGSFKFTRDNGTHYCNYAVIEGQDWYLFNISSAVGLNDYSKKSTFLGMLLMVKMVLLLIAVTGGILLWIISNNRKVKSLTAVLENVTNHAPGGMFQINPETMQLSFVNEGLYQMIGCGAEKFEERYHNNYENLIYEPDRKMVLDKIREKLVSSYEYKMRFRLQTYSGAVYWVQQVNNAYTENGQMRIYGVLVDIEEFKAFEDELFLSNQRYKIIVNQMEACFIEFDIKSMMAVETKNFYEIFGRNLEEEKDGSYVHEDERAIVCNKFKRVFNGISIYEECEARIQKGDDRYLWCLIRYYTLTDENGELIRLICKITDIDKRKCFTVELQNRVQQDPLTGLYNKSVTEELIKSYLCTSPEDIQALFVLDIDNFKGINDTYGHASGDKVLKLMAQTLRSLFRKSDVVGRIGGDEFVVCMKDCFDEEYALKKADQLSKEFLLAASHEQISTSCSIGVALYPRHGKDWKELFEKADTALYMSKRRGKNTVTIYKAE